VTSGFGNYQECQRGPSNFCYGWRQEEGKPKMQCPTYLDCVRNGLHTVSQDSTAFLVHMPNGAFVCEDMAAKFDGPLPRMALMLRDPFSLVISSYIYHAQKPTPENWVINEFTAPCVPNAEQTCVSLSLSLNGMHALAHADPAPDPDPDPSPPRSIRPWRRGGNGKIQHSALCCGLRMPNKSQQ